MYSQRQYWLIRLSQPPDVLVRKSLRLVQRTMNWTKERVRDWRTSTFCPFSSVPPGEILRYFHVPQVGVLVTEAEQIKSLSDLYMDHRFDLLGSGWLQVRHGMRSYGLEELRYPAEPAVDVDGDGKWLGERVNTANLQESRRIWRLISADYVPIDWHIDFKSGYRWQESTWFRRVPYGHRPGADIKVPWELARMQHLPQLAWAYALAGTGVPDLSPRSTYAGEFRNQILDFVSANPPRFGVNWRSPMDVAIRAANWLVAYDLFKALGAEFDTPFEDEFRRSVYQHGQHVIKNLEWNEGVRGNHYLSNVAGLLFIAAYLPRSSETDAWLAFAIHELIVEMDHQFHAEGTNFESSTSYHRLAAEMVAYATLLVLALSEDKNSALLEYDHRRLVGDRPLVPAPVSLSRAPGSEHSTPFSGWYFERLERMAEFTIHISKPNAQVAQIGDNDSGRFLKLFPQYRKLATSEAITRYLNLEKYEVNPDDAVYWDEDFLDHRNLVAVINTMFGREDFELFAGDCAAETRLLSTITRKRVSSFRQEAAASGAEAIRFGSSGEWDHYSEEQRSVPENMRRVLEISTPGGSLHQGMRAFAYPEFGLYIFHSTRMFLAVRCGSIGRDGYGGHAHNDQLSVELNIDGEDWVSDPGTYIYTPLPDRRNEYRADAAHFGPPSLIVGSRPLDRGLFHLPGELEATCKSFTSTAFLGTVTVSGMEATRSVKIEDNRILIVDTSNQLLVLAPKISSLDDVRQPPFSNAYGKRLSD